MNTEQTQQQEAGLESCVRVSGLVVSHIASLQVPGVLLPHGPGVLQRRPAAPQAAAVGDEGGDQDVEGAGGRDPGARQIQRQPAGDDRHRLGQRSASGRTGEVVYVLFFFFNRALCFN